jgi:ABC-type nitrate/sulfonate/bicarbonate transport system substrate-binding protein
VSRHNNLNALHRLWRGGILRDRVSERPQGQTIAVNAFGGAVEMAAYSVLRKNGLTPDRDVRIIEARFGAMEAMTRENKVQVGSFLAPFWSKAQKRRRYAPAVPEKGRHGYHPILALCRQG